MRLARLHAPGVLYHVICRFADGAWFLRGAPERAAYLRWLGYAMQRSDWRCLGYALMSNHIHLAMVAGDESLASWAKRAHSPFSQWVNERFERFGHVFAHRPKDFAVLPENEAMLLAYIHNNPVAAGVCGAARDSAWTSHRAYLGLARRPRWLDVELGLARCGFDGGESFDRFVTANPGESAESDVAAVARRAAQRGALVAATPSTRSTPIVARAFAHVRPDPVRLLELVEETTHVALARYCSRQRSGALVAARQVAVQAGRAMGLSAGDLATAMGLAAQTVSRLSRRAMLPQCEDATARVLRAMEQELAEKAQRAPREVPGEPA